MPLTSSQIAAVEVRGNVIVVAGAGTGKTSTLVARCLDVITEKEGSSAHKKASSLDRILMVTFTEAAAAEMRHRLRIELQKRVDAPPTPAAAAQFAEQLALVETAKISTIHSFCLRLVQSHFHELGLDPEVRVLDDQQCRVLIEETLDALIEDGYADRLPISDAVKALIAAYAPDRDGLIRELVLKLHQHAQSLAKATYWIQTQQEACAADSPVRWEAWLEEAFQEWRHEWIRALEPESDFERFNDCLTALRAAGDQPDRATILNTAEAIRAADEGDWKKQKTKRRKPFSKLFDEAAFLGSVAADGALETEWQAVRGHLGALLALTETFTERFTAAKRELGGVDFPDLEQLALRLLLKSDGTASEVARDWQGRMDYVFVDECQDINGAQDAILRAVARTGAEANRFLVGDVKQSIYRFRLADPHIFRRYEVEWGAESGQRISLAENFRSRPGILAFVNALFAGLMRESFGDVAYEPLQAGEGGDMARLNDRPCVELHFIRKESDTEAAPAEEGVNEIADVSATEREARLVASRLRELKASGFVIWDKDAKCERAVEWRDMAILMRSPGPRTEVFAKVFHQLNIPLEAARAGFLEATEVSDLVSLLKLLDNPLQDIPLLAVLRSPLVGLTLDELAAIRADNRAKPFWSALRRFAAGDDATTGDGRDAFHRVPGKTEEGDGDTVERVPTSSTDALRAHASTFLTQFEQWRERVRQVGPSLCLEQVLVDTGYDVLLGANERGAQQLANVRRLLDLARQFDPYLRQGLYRFLRFLKALDDAEDSLEPAPPPSRDAVRLMSIHRSKGLEFPIVALAGLGSRFNLPELNGLILLDEHLGLTARAMTASGAGRYPTLPFWLAARHQRAQGLAEELRLLYVASTRARDRLICSGALPRKDQGRWETRSGAVISDRDLLSAQQPVAWLLGWLSGVTKDEQWTGDAQGESDLMTWELWDPLDERLGPPGTVESTGTTITIDPTIEPAMVAAVAERVSKGYPHEAAAKEPAKSSVSALRRRATELVDEDAVNRFTQPRKRATVSSGTGKLTGAERGTLHHRFLEHVEMAGADNVDGLARQAQALVQGGIFTEPEAAALNLTTIAAFWASAVGEEIRARSAHIRRELPFTARFGDAEVRRLLGQEPAAAMEDEFVVVQGVVDLAVVLDDEIWVLDFKTDDVKGDELVARAEHHRPQLQLYAAALERVFGRPVRRQWLHFLTAGETVEFGEPPPPLSLA